MVRPQRHKGTETISEATISAKAAEDAKARVRGPLRGLGAVAQRAKAAAGRPLKLGVSVSVAIYAASRPTEDGRAQMPSPVP